MLLYSTEPFGRFYGKNAIFAVFGQFASGQCPCEKRALAALHEALSGGGEGVLAFFERRERNDDQPTIT